LVNAVIIIGGLFSTYALSDYSMILNEGRSSIVFMLKLLEFRFPSSLKPSSNRPSIYWHMSPVSLWISLPWWWPGEVITEGVMRGDAML